VGISLLVTIPAGLLVLPVRTPTEKCDTVGNKKEKKGSWEILKIKPVSMTVIYTFVFSISWGYKFPTLEPHLREVKGSNIIILQNNMQKLLILSILCCSSNFQPKKLAHFFLYPLPCTLQLDHCVDILPTG